MRDLWRATARLGMELHAQRLAGAAKKVATLNSSDEFRSVRSSFGPNADPSMISALERAWQEHPEVSPRELAAALMAASETAAIAGEEGATELVWTGPSSGYVPVRHTETVLREVIDSAEDRVLLVSFVVHKVPSIIEALRDASARQVSIDVLLESSTEHGGTVSYDSVEALRANVPSARLHVWKQVAAGQAGQSWRGAVHAKAAVSDASIAFITSANLTGAAMERNMELGILIKGGRLPKNLDGHLRALTTSGVMARV